MGIGDGKVVREGQGRKIDLNADEAGSGGDLELRHVSFFFNGVSDVLTTQKKAYDCTFVVQFGKMESHVSAGEFIVNFPVYYRLGKGTSPFPAQYAEQAVHSFLKFKFTLEGTKLFCRLKCDSLTALKDYDLRNLLSILYPSLSQTNMAYSVTDNHALLCLVTEPVHVRQVVSHESTDAVNVEAFIKIIKDYRLHCLRRFEELTVQRESIAYHWSLELGDVLDSIAVDYHLVKDAEYKRAFKILSAIELNETYQNDPQIFMSLNGVRDALSFFRQQAKMARRGVDIDLCQLKLIMDELESHEGNSPKDNVWLPSGTAVNLSLQMEEFLGFEIMQQQIIL
ncbi:hypothetical protein [Legionella shakespearei]|uniref:Substrate of the Dot/Icm secretion system n=1 Tax=Legionella shakespearei DSM 23087 TaxID=1122169 RepID=A0A0W0YQU9_9GAMM|nr:hypothetical protein [Legionella shakespearei]KTD59273.1 substrate of the Dot/Icm secretion system [Legionella shakespearei DSM 23087]